MLFLQHQRLNHSNLLKRFDYRDYGTPHPKIFISDTDRLSASRHVQTLCGRLLFELDVSKLQFQRRRRRSNNSVDNVIWRCCH